MVGRIHFSFLFFRQRALAQVGALTWQNINDDETFAVSLVLCKR